MGRSEPRRGLDAKGRAEAASWADQTVVNLGLTSSGQGAAVESLTQAKARRLYGQWLRRVSQYAELRIVADEPEGILWCYMDPKGRPSVTPGLARESRDLQRSVKVLFDDLETSDVRPFRYMVWGSKTPGVFNLGGDLRLFARLVRAQDRQALRNYAIACIDVIYANATSLELPLITVSLVEGDALGGGFEAAISSDLVIAERNARFGLPEILFNLFPGMGAYSLIARRINGIEAERMILSGRIYTAEELYNIGLVDLLVEPGQARQAVYDLVTPDGRRHAAQCAIYQVGRRVNPLSYKELYDIALLWVDTVLGLGEADLRKMERLAAAQDRRRRAPNRDS
jgi:DSF synthase